MTRSFRACSAMMGGLAARTSALSSIASALVIIGLGLGWVFGREPLARHVATIRQEPVSIRFNWPVTMPSGSERIDTMQTWMPGPIQQNLVDIAGQNLGIDPFDQSSLERTRRALIATGWFARIHTIERRPDGRVVVMADWRVPAAIVNYQKRDYLVATGSEILRLPPRTPVAKGSMPTIMNPHLGPPKDDLGIIYGQSWVGGDVQAGIDLVRHLRTMPEAKRITAVDLTDFIQSGHLTLVTDSGSRIIWGSALTELGPGEVSASTRRERLRQILADRFDLQQKLIEIHTPVVLVDKTVAQQ